MPKAAALALLLAAAALWPAARAAAQADQPVRNAFTPAGQRLSAVQIRDELVRRLNLNPLNEAALWNTGYDFYRNYPRNQDTAQAIKDGFLQARRFSADPARRLILYKAAIYWEKVHDYGVTNVPAGQNPNSRHKIYYGDTSKASTLALRPAGVQARGARVRGSQARGDWPGRFINKRPPYRGRPDNPYPGKYYPGLYPP